MEKQVEYTSDVTTRDIITEMVKENDIVEDAYYLVNIFKRHKNPVTQIHIQNLMFLFEAYYMNMKDVDFLYECEFTAWNFGPVATPLYDSFKKYGTNEINLTMEEIEQGNSISEEKKKLLKDLYNVFGNFSAMELVQFVHAEGSPWEEIWDKEQYSIIPKEKIKMWFRQYVQR